MMEYSEVPICHVCGEQVLLNSNELGFVACYECNIPICKSCFDHLAKQGGHASCVGCGASYEELGVEEQVPNNHSTVARNVSSGSLMDAESSDDSHNAMWKNRVQSWQHRNQNAKNKESQIPHPQLIKKQQKSGDASEPLSRVIPLPNSQLVSYRAVIILRLIILGLFLCYRIKNPVDDAFALWLTSVICEFWFAIIWVFDQFPKWFPINRETYLNVLSERYEREDELAAVDIFITTRDPMIEPPWITANTVLSVLAMDYPAEKVCCYVSDDGAAMLTFESLVETAEFARKWVPFCKKFSVEPRAPEYYFSQKFDYLKDRVHSSFVKERRAMKRDYEEYKVRINALVAKAQKTPEEGWIMQNGTPWPGKDKQDHPGMIQVFLGHNGTRDIEGNVLPRIVYVSRETTQLPPSQNSRRQKFSVSTGPDCKVRVSAILTNAPFILNLDYDNYVNNSKLLREAMCFLMDPKAGQDICYVQFPQRFTGIDKNHSWGDRNTVFFDVNMKGLDGVQGPLNVGTGCVLKRQALYGYAPPSLPSLASSSCSWIGKGSSWCCQPKKPSVDPLEVYRDSKRGDLNAAIYNLKEIDSYDEYERSLLISRMSFESTFGISSSFIDSTLIENGGVPQSANPLTLIKEAIHVISCGYEQKTSWGREIGWIYGSVTEDVLTGFKMHCRGWRSVYCIPLRTAFQCSTATTISDRLSQALYCALGSVEIFLGRHCPLWYGYQGGRLKWLQRMAYVSTIVYPFTSIPLIVYCTLPAVCLLTGKSILPPLSTLSNLLLLGLFTTIVAANVLELWWSSVNVEDWWQNEQSWVMETVSAHLFALLQGLFKMVTGININFSTSSKSLETAYHFKWTTILVPPATLLVINIVGVVAGFSDALYKGYDAWGPLIGKVFFALWVILHLYPFLKGLSGNQRRTPTIVVVWCLLLASIFSLIWVKMNPFGGGDDKMSKIPSCISIDC